MNEFKKRFSFFTSEVLREFFITPVFRFFSRQCVVLLLFLFCSVFVQFVTTVQFKKHEKHA